MRHPVVSMMLMLCAALAAAPAARGAASIERARVLMGTLCIASATADDTARAADALDAAFDEIARLETVMSAWREDSELSRLNRTRVASPCSPDLAAVLDSALALARLTGGAFDPTVEPLVAAWDLRGDGRVPDAAALARARAGVGWAGLTLDPAHATARLARDGMGVDLGGIGKGFALDRARAMLARGGAHAALINLGGELAALGGPCSVTVAHPAHRLAPVMALVVHDAAVSTSGQGERGFDSGGARFGHILDPHTGRPVASDASVTVICGSATRADALSTALLVLGREKAAAFAREHPEAGVLWLEPAGNAVRAWRWNVTAVRALPGATVQWVD